MQLVTKDVKDPVTVEDNADRPMDPNRLEILAKIFSMGGVDVSAFRQAIATGDKTEYLTTMANALTEFIYPGSGPSAPGQAVDPATGQLTGHPAVSRSRPATIGVTGGPGANPRPSPAAQKANSNDPYLNLTRGWFKPGPDAA